MASQQAAHQGHQGTLVGLDVDAVCAMFEEMHLAKYIPTLRRDEINGSTLEELVNSRELSAFISNAIHRARIRGRVKEIYAQQEQVRLDAACTVPPRFDVAPPDEPPPPYNMPNPSMYSEEYGLEAPAQGGRHAADPYAIPPAREDVMPKPLPTSEWVPQKRISPTPAGLEEEEKKEKKEQERCVSKQLRAVAPCAPVARPVQPKQPNERIAIGIDLDTNSCMAVFRNVMVDIICNEQGNFTTPSYVAFTEEDILVGEAAKNQAVLDPSNTVFDAKRLIGRRFQDRSVQSNMKEWPFKVVPKGDKPAFEVKYKGKMERYLPEEISSMVLTKMKDTARDYLGFEVKDAVLTVPAYFNDAQRHATKNAGVMSGLNVLRILNRPTAAIIAYGLVNGPEEKNVVIFDMGRRALDVCLLTVEDGITELKATGTIDCGGETLDNLLVEHCVLDFKRKHKLDLMTSQRSVRRLRSACEQAKRVLYGLDRTSIQVDSLFHGVDYSTMITARQFEKMCSACFKNCLKCVERVLRDGRVSKAHVHEIVLVGGSTRIPALQKRLTTFFNGTKPRRSIDPVEVVARGAAVQAATLIRNKRR